jgi:two-component system response regulator RegX3
MTMILIVEDEPSLSEPLAYLLEREGYETTIAADGLTAVSEFERNGADLVLLDLMLPGLSGTEVCREIRARSTVPIIMLTAKDSEIDIVVGLELGADDYVTKPYSTRELLARIRAVMRRRIETDDDGEATLEAGSVRMDIERHTVSVGGLFPVYAQYGDDSGKQMMVPVLNESLPEYAGLIPTSTPSATPAP